MSVLTKRALTAFATAGGFGIIPDDGEFWDDDLWNGMKAAIALVRAEVLEEAARVAEDCSVALNGTYEAIHIAAAIRALKNPA